MTLHNRVTIIIQTNNCRFQVRRNDIYIIICCTARRNTVGFTWIEQKKVTRPKCHRYSNPWECKVTYDSIIDLISVFVNVSLNNRYSKICIDMTSQVNINFKAKSIVRTCIFLFDEEADGSIVLKLTWNLADEMCRIISVPMYMSNAYSARFITLCNESQCSLGNPCFSL